MKSATSQGVADFAIFNIGIGDSQIPNANHNLLA